MDSFLRTLPMAPMKPGDKDMSLLAQPVKATWEVEWGGMGLGLAPRN